MLSSWEENQIEFSTTDKEEILRGQKKLYKNLSNLICIILTILFIFILQFQARRNLVEVSIWNGTLNNFCSISDGKINLINGNKNE